MPGRHGKPAEGRKRIPVLCWEQEADVIRAAAGAAGKSVSEFMVEAGVKSAGRSDPLAPALAAPALTPADVTARVVRACAEAAVRVSVKSDGALDLAGVSPRYAAVVAGLHAAMLELACGIVTDGEGAR